MLEQYYLIIAMVFKGNSTENYEEGVGLHIEPERQKFPEAREFLDTQVLRDIYDNTPALQIGTFDEYRTYLKTINPNSEVQEVVWHGTNTKFDTFEKGKRRFDTGFYFGHLNYIRHNGYGSRLVEMGALLNVEHLFNKTLKRLEWQTPAAEMAAITEALDQNADGIRFTNEAGNEYYYLVFEPEQIHVLGNASDAAQFRQYLEGQSE